MLLLLMALTMGTIEVCRPLEKMDMDFEAVAANAEVIGSDIDMNAIRRCEMQRYDRRRRL